MHAQTILFPTDFSELSHAGLQYATSLALDMGAKLLIVHVDEPAAAYGGGGDVFYAVPPEADEEAQRERLEAVVPTNPDVPYEHRLLIGEPATEIVDLAVQEGVDMIVMSTHGRTGLMRLLMGSVAEAVVRRAPCPVLTLKQPHDTPAEAGRKEHHHV